MCERENQNLEGVGGSVRGSESKGGIGLKERRVGERGMERGVEIWG